MGVSRPGKPSKDDWKRIAGRESEEVLLQQTVDAEMNEVVSPLPWVPPGLVLGWERLTDH